MKGRIGGSTKFHSHPIVGRSSQLYQVFSLRESSTSTLSLHILVDSFYPLNLKSFIRRKLLIFKKVFDVII